MPSRGSVNPKTHGTFDDEISDTTLRFVTDVASADCDRFRRDDDTGGVSRPVEGFSARIRQQNK